MLIRLSGTTRCLVGRLVALTYLLCVLAPASALALGDGRLSEHCLFDDGLAAATSHPHDSQAHAEHLSTGHHDHSGHQSSMTHQHGGGTAPGDTPSQPGHAAMDLQCCGMLCVAALPASIGDVATPWRSHAFALPESGDHLADNLPARRYRPPIV